jgi:hypothetical protein
MFPTNNPIIRMTYKTTFVTCLFNCHKDNSYQSQANNYYFKNSLRTLLLEEPLIIYCDEEYKEKYITIRKTLGYENITKVITMDISDFYMYKYKSHIESFKKFEENSKMNANIYILWFSKFEMILKSIENNYFNTTHFCWLDINLLSKTFNNSTNYLEYDIHDKLSEIAKNPRDRFAIQTINCWSNTDYENLDIYFSQYRWIVSCCFFTTDITTALFIIPKIIEKSEEMLKLNYCQSDESIFAFIIDQYPYYFNLYIGDYQDTIHNYFTVEKNHHYVHWIMNLNKEKNKHPILKGILDEYKKNYLSQNSVFPYEDML